MNDDIKKIIPSRLETGVQHLLHNTLGKHIPTSMTPNRLTVLGGVGGLTGIIFALLSRISPLFLIGTIFGLLCHLICDDLDGYVARKRNMASDAGSYLDLLVDILHITYLIIALAFAGIVSTYIALFLVPVYALIIFTAMNYIIYYKEFLFPRLGPVETHVFFIIICIGSMIMKDTPLFHIWGYEVRFADLVFVVGGALMYYEMIRLQIQLFCRLKKNNDME